MCLRKARSETNMKCTYSFSVQNTELLEITDFLRKIEHHLPKIKHLLPLDAAEELMNSSDSCVNIQLLK